MSFEHDQFDSFQIQGHWWIPDSDRQLAGELRYESGSITIQLYGSFHERLFIEQPNIECLYGQALDGTLMSVHNCHYSQWAEVIGLHAHHAVLACQSLIVGGHHPRSQRFESISLEFPNFDIWLHENIFDESDSVIRVRRPEILASVNLPRLSASATLGFGYDRSGAVSRLCIRQTPTFQIAWNEAQPLSTHVQAAHTVEQLFSFLFDIPVQTATIKLTRPLMQPLENCSTNEMIAHTAFDPSQLFVERSNSTETDPGCHQSPFRWERIRPHFAALVREFLESEEAIATARNLYFATRRVPSSFMNETFISTMQAIEILSRQLVDSNYIETSEYRPIKDELKRKIPENVDEDLRRSIGTALDYANELRFRSRLIRLIRRLESETASLFCDDVEQFAKGVVDTRNYFTHFTKHNNQSVHEGVGLYWATRKLETMFKVLLLTNAGVPETDVRDLLRGHADQERTEWKGLAEAL